MADAPNGPWPYGLAGPIAKAQLDFNGPAWPPIPQLAQLTKAKLIGNEIEIWDGAISSPAVTIQFSP